jgi:hypothetical protein
MFFQNINYTVTIIAAAIGMGVGFIYFSPWVFGKQWLKVRTGSHEVLAAKFKPNRPMTGVWVLTALGKIVSAFIIAALFNSLIVTSIGGMVVLALCLWLGFVVPVKLTDYLFSGDNLACFVLSIGYELVAVLLMTLIIGIWA